MIFHLIDSQAKVSVLLAKFQPWPSARNWPQAHDNLSVALDGLRPTIGHSVALLDPLPLSLGS